MDVAGGKAGRRLGFDLAGGGGDGDGGSVADAALVAAVRVPGGKATSSVIVGLGGVTVEGRLPL